MQKYMVAGGTVGIIFALTVFFIWPAHIIDGDVLSGKQIFQWIMTGACLSTLISLYYKRELSVLLTALFGAVGFGLVAWSLHGNLPPTDMISVFAKCFLGLIGYGGVLMTLILFPVFLEKE